MAGGTRTCKTAHTSDGRASGRARCPAAPVITSFNATVLSGHMVSLTGTVADENPAGVQVMFSGVASGSATANAAGQFSLTTPASTLGTINAQARDTQMLCSQSKSSTLPN